MEIIYRAKDGTIFNDESECEGYELTLLFKEPNVKGHYVLLTKDKSICDIKELINDDEHVDSVFTDTPEALKAVNDLFDYIGERRIPSEGKYYVWSGFSNNWEDIEELIIKHEDEISELRNIKESLSGLKSVTAW